jgi:hypothetical protein
MPTDPNWLYSTIAQSSAAIVAIIGGFITATILGLTAEKKSLVKQLGVKERNLDSLKQYHLDVITVNMEDLEKDIANLKIQIKEFSYPPNLGWGIIVLGFLAFFGILLPVLIMANEAFFSWAKLLTLITFWLGLIGVFTYVVSQIRTLKK